MARTSLEKRLVEAESKAKIQQGIRAEAEAREVTPARLEEIMLQWDATNRDGHTATLTYLETLSNGESLRAYRERDQWVQERAKQITPEYLDQLLAEGVGIERWTEAELCACLDFNSNVHHINFRRVPEKVLKSIADGTCQYTDEELSRMYQ